MRVHFVSSEVFPLIKTGGLADVSGALPLALTAQGTEVQVIMPAYRGVFAQCAAAEKLGSLQPLHDLRCDIYRTQLPGSAVSLLLVDCPILYDRDGGPYQHPEFGEWGDNPLRFGVLAKVAAMLACPNALQDWRPDIVHCNDWQTGLVPYYLKQLGSRARSVFSVHNMAFQGNVHPDWRYRLMLNPQDFRPQGYEFYNQLSFMKAGLFYADQLSTVSPTYAREIQTEAFGFGFQGLLQQRAADLTGILNGIDTEIWDPSQDSHLPAHYSVDALAGKQVVKRALQTEVGLPVSAESPLLGIVSRLTYQKGLDLVLDIAEPLLASGAQLVVLGSGDAQMEQQFLALAAAHPTQVAVTIGYREPLSHRIMAGADLFLMPSRFEPCGLNQMYGLRYGTPPIVANTGGLADSVSAGQATAAEALAADRTGFVLTEHSSQALLAACREALALHAHSGHWTQLQRQAMRQDVSWKHSAAQYRALYDRTLSI